MRSELKKNETLLLIIRQHWINLILPVLAWVALTVLLFLFIDPVWALIIAFATAFYPLYLILDWRHNLWAVTTSRVIDEHGFISRRSKESPLDKINNVEYNQTLAGRIFGYGDVSIQTAAEMGDTTYRFIHHPKLLKDTITRAQEEYKTSAITNQATQLAQAIKANIGNVMQQQPTHQTFQSPQAVSAEIEKLFELLQKGAITQEEYMTQKARLLNH